MDKLQNDKNAQKEKKRFTKSDFANKMHKNMGSVRITQKK